MRIRIQILAICLVPAVCCGCRHVSQAHVKNGDDAALPGHSSPADVVRAPPLIANSQTGFLEETTSIPQTIVRPARVRLPSAASVASETGTASQDSDASIRRGLTSLFTGRAPRTNRDIRLTAFDDGPGPPTVEADPPEEEHLRLLPISQAADPMPTMTLGELERLAATHNPTLQTAAAIAQKAMGVRRQVGRCANPIFGYTGQEMGADGTSGQQGVFLNQNIVLGHKLEWNERVVNGDVQTLLWQAETQRYRVRNDVRRQFFATLGAQEQVKLARELEQIADEGVRNAQILVDALQAARPDLYQAEIQLNEVQILRRNAEFAHRAAWQQLANLVGVPTLPMVEIDHPLDQDLPFRDVEASRAQILSASPQLQQARAEVQRAQALIGRERAQVIPNLQLQASTAYADGPDDGVASLQIGVPLPLLNRNDGNIDRATADYRRATWDVQRLELQLQSDLAGAYAEYQQAHNRVQTFRDEILPREQQTLDLIQQGYPTQFDFLRVLTARRSYFEARIDYLDALVDLRQTEVLLDGLLLTGGLDQVPDTSVDDSLRGHALSGQ